MPLTILQMVNKAEAELGLTQGSTVFGAAAQITDTQMGALANRALDEIRRMNRWTALQFEYNLVVSPPLSTTGNMVAQSAVITNIPSTATLVANAFMVSGSGWPQASRIKTVDSPTQVTITMENTNTGNVIGETLLFMQDTYPMPTGFDWMNNRTMWDRTNRWELLGPDSPQMDQWHRSGIVATGPRRHFRQLGPLTNQFRIWPPPAEIVAPLQLVFEYLSNAAVAVSGGTTYAQYFTGDSDTCLLDEQALIMGMKWLFWEAKGFGSYATMQSRWVDYVNRQIARDGAAPTLQLAKRNNPVLISPANTQEGFFPGPSGSNMS